MILAGIIIVAIVVLSYILFADRNEANITIFYTSILVLIFPFRDFVAFNQSFVIGNILFLILFFLYLIKNDGFRLQIDKTYKYYLLLTFIYGTSLIHSIFRYGDSNEISALIYFFYIIVQSLMLYILYFNIIDNHHYFKRLYFLICFLGCIISVYLIYEYFFIAKSTYFTQYAYQQKHSIELGSWAAYQDTLSSERQAGNVLSWLGGTNGRAIIALLLFTFVLSMNSFARVFKDMLIRFTTLILLTISIILQVSRITYGYFVIICLCSLYLTLAQRNSFLKNVVFLVIIGVIFFQISGSNPIIMSKMDDLTLRGGSYTGRVTLMKDALDYSGENFYLGNGFQSEILNKDYLDKNYQLLGSGRSHNFFLTLLMDTGVFGIIAIILFLTSFVKNALSLNYIKLKSFLLINQKNAGILITICFVLCSMTSHGILTNTFFTFFIVFAASIGKYKHLVLLAEKRQYLGQEKKVAKLR